MIDPNDDLDAILAPRQGHSPTDFREQVLRRTQTRLVQARRLRGIGRSALVAGVFVAGGAIGWLVRPLPAPEPRPDPRIEIRVVAIPALIPVLLPSEAPLPPRIESVQAETGPEIELQAEQADGAPAATLYRAAGDAYLRAEDYPNASRCYRLYLVRAGDPALSLTPDDSWLLTSLKNAAFQEKLRVQKTD